MKRFLRRIGWELGILLMYKLKELVCGIGDEAKGMNECLIGYKLKELVYRIGDEGKGMNECLIGYKLKELVCGPNKLFPWTSIQI